MLIDIAAALDEINDGESGTMPNMRCFVKSQTITIPANTESYGGIISGISDAFDHVQAACVLFVYPNYTNTFDQRMSVADDDVVQIFYSLTCASRDEPVTQNIRIMIMGYND
ncbi:MAG: hypothetical protein QM689_12775 [Oscillospiraceae bacterium]